MFNLIVSVMNFNTNQNRHLYVANSYVDKFPTDGKPNIGDITLKVVGTGKDKEIYFQYQGADTALKSDRIQVKNLDYVKATKKEDLRTPFKSQLVSLDTTVNGGNLVAGEDYVLRIVLRQWIGMSDEDQYFKDVAVHATASMTPVQFYEKMVEQLNLCFSREIGATTKSNPYLDFKADANGITITEKEQPWTLGLESQEPVLFDAQPTTIYVDGTDSIWGTVTPKTANISDIVVGTTGYGNGHKIADLEYFCMGERGDQYRMVGWPNIIPTTYLVKPNEEYNVLDIHHAFTDDGVSSYRSDKDITIVSTDAGVINKIISAINKATGETFPALAAAATEG